MATLRRRPTFEAKGHCQAETETNAQFGGYKSNREGHKVEERPEAKALVDLLDIFLVDALHEKPAVFRAILPQAPERKGYCDEGSGKDRSGNIPLRVLQIFRHQSGRKGEEGHQQQD